MSNYKKAPRGTKKLGQGGASIATGGAGIGAPGIALGGVGIAGSTLGAAGAAVAATKGRPNEERKVLVVNQHDLQLLGDLLAKITASEATPGSPAALLGQEREFTDTLCKVLKSLIRCIDLLEMDTAGVTGVKGVEGGPSSSWAVAAKARQRALYLLGHPDVAENDRRRAQWLVAMSGKQTPLDPFEALVQLNQFVYDDE